MNILVLTSEYPYEKDNNSDRTKVVGYFAKEWVKQGHKVIAIVNSSSFPRAFYTIGDRAKKIISKAYDVSRAPDRLWTKRFSYEENGVYVENLPMTKYIPHGKFSQKTIQKQILEIERVLKERDFNPDIVTGHWVNPQVMLIPELARKYGAKAGFVFHADYSKENCRRFKVQTYLDQIDHIGFRSKSALDVAKGYLHFKNEPFVAASGVPDTFIEKYKSLPARTCDGKLNVITAARLVEYKKIDKIISAIAESLERDSVELTVVGEGPLKEDLIEQAKSVGMENNTHFLGQIPRDDLQESMRRSDVFVLISKRETFGLVYIEAMLHGCIVIASRFGGVDGIIEDGINGFLCEEGNAEELTEVFNRIAVMDRSQRQNISEKANLTAIQYSESNTANRYLMNINR